MAYDGTLVLWRIVASVFFREIRPRGTHNIPQDGPIIFAIAPHHNQLLDPFPVMLEVYHATHRRMKNLVASKTMKGKATGIFASLISSIPVVRPQDDAKPGSGEIWLSEDDPLLVRGHVTKFRTELASKMQLMLPKSTGSAVGTIVEVISDTELRLKTEFDGKGTSIIREEIEEAKRKGGCGLSYKVMPYVDQQGMYVNVFRCLKEGGCIGIFPEGGSHDRTELLPLKAGVALMALGAMEQSPGLQVRIVPVGLSYFHAHRFRSRAVVEFGPALDVSSELVDQFRQGGDEKRKATGKLLDKVYEALRTVTISAPDFETLMVIQAARRLYKVPGQNLTLSQVIQLNKRFLEAYKHFKHEPRIQKLRENVLKYNRHLRDLGLRDHQVFQKLKTTWKAVLLLLYRAVLLSIWSVLALPGIALNGPIFILAATISHRKAKEALASSNVQIAARDVLATWKVLVSLGVTPILYAFYAIIATSLVVKADAPLKWSVFTLILTILTLPCVGYAALKFGEAGMDVVKSLPPLIISLFPGQQRLFDQMKAKRIALSDELTDVINEFAPQLYEDFNKDRVLVPSASVPSSAGQQGLWRRKSATGGVDAQGLGFSHPMTWLDERLFGWSPQKSKGSRTNQEMSPYLADEERADYEEVVDRRGCYHHLKLNYPQTRTARFHGSYAVLHKLNMNMRASSGKCC
ncbi:glycerol-3-phosphate O-acyltransferase [Ramaria rubella]|nr:glycerol-3-phosphate O-acyltransferase [Ramaria rubella]